MRKNLSLKRMAAILLALLAVYCEPSFAAFRACGTVATGSGISVSIPSPTGAQLNDVVVIIVDFSTSAALTLPSGFTNVAGSPVQFNVVSRNDVAYKTAIGTRIATSSEPADYAATLSGSYPWMGVACAWSGRNTSSPVVISQTTSAAGSASPVTITLTGGTANAGDDLLWIPSFSKNGAAPTWTAPTGFTSEIQGDDLSDAYVHMDLSIKDDVSAGATGNISGTETGLAADQQGFVISLAAAGSGTCTHSGQAKDGSISVPNGTSGSYWGKNGAFVSPDCSTVYYWSPQVGNFVVN